MLLPRVQTEQHQEPRWSRVAQERSIDGAAAIVASVSPRLAIVTLLLIVGLTAATVPCLGEEFLPNFKETDFLMHWVEKPGTSLEAMRPHHRSGEQGTARHSRRAQFRLAHRPRRSRRRSRRPEFHRAVDQPRSRTSTYEPTVAKIQEVVDGYPGSDRDLLTYLKERIKEVLTGAGATIVVRIYGPDLTGLRAKAAGGQRSDRRRSPA